MKSIHVRLISRSDEKTPAAQPYNSLRSLHSELHGIPLIFQYFFFRHIFSRQILFFLLQIEQQMQYNSAIAMVGGFSVSFLKNTILDIFLNLL